MTTLHISPANSSFSSDYYPIEARPAGKATFKAFSIGVPKVYFDAHPVSPAWAQEAIVSMALDAIRIKAIAARNAGESSFSIEARLPDFLASLATSGRLTKEELEDFLNGCKDASKAFLRSRGHNEEGIDKKVDVLHSLASKAGAPVPPWSETNLALLASWLEALSANEAIAEAPAFTKLLNKVENMSTKKADLADSL